MVSKDFVEELTVTYIYSYNKTMEIVRNPGLAVQAALGITMTIAALERQRGQVTNPFEVLFSHIERQARQQDTERCKEDEDTSKKTMMRMALK